MQKNLAIVAGAAMLSIAAVVVSQNSYLNAQLGGPGKTSTTSASSVSSVPPVQSSANKIDYTYICEQARRNSETICFHIYQAEIEICLEDNAGQPKNLEICIKDATTESTDCRQKAQDEEYECLSKKQVSCTIDLECSFPMPGNPKGLNGKCVDGLCKF